LMLMTKIKCILDSVEKPYHPVVSVLE
jgi:hypothetical protein